MIENILTASNLSLARDRVIANKGSYGVDLMRVSELKEYVSYYRGQIQNSIRNRTYQPAAIRGVSIPKGKGKTRLLGIPTVVDRWLQQAVSQRLASKFEFTFETHSYGFRPRKNAQQAVLQSQRYLQSGCQDIVDIDLKSFFDEVPHYKLLQIIYHKVQCPTTLWLIRKWLRAPILVNGKLRKRRKGIPQGSPLSPLLSNVLLDQLDKYLKYKEYKFIRYADDFSVYTTSKSKAREIGNAIYLFLRDKLELPINKEKSGIRRPNTFKILGYGFVPIYKKGVKGQYQIVAEASSWKRLKRKLKHLTKKTLPISLADRIAKLKSIYRGWLQYFRIGNIQAKLKKLDEWLRNRLRYCIWHDWKKVERKRKNLIRLGISQEQAYAWSRTRMGGWAVAQSPILKTTITVKLLSKRGYESMLKYYQSIKF